MDAGHGSWFFFGHISGGYVFAGKVYQISLGLQLFLLRNDGVLNVGRCLG